MPDSAEVVGDDLVVVHNGETVTLSLAIPFSKLDVWLEDDETRLWREFHEFIRDQLMPDSARQQILDWEGRNVAFAIELTRGWESALSDRLQKSVQVSLFGDTTVPPSQPTSGSATESEPTESEPTARPRSSRSTRTSS